MVWDVKTWIWVPRENVGFRDVASELPVMGGGPIGWSQHEVMSQME